MSDFICPFCNHTMAISDTTCRKYLLNFDRILPCEGDFPKSGMTNTYVPETKPELIQLTFYKCPHCEQFSINVTGKGIQTENISTFVRPSSFAKHFPEYVPQSIRDDYEEACAIVKLSPKASATLSRRCLQNMIRDFWGISKKRLIDEINELRSKVPVSQWKVIDCLRQLGNIGAHPEADTNLIIEIDPQDAQKLIQVIELLIKQWYIERFEQEQLFNEILTLNEAKQKQRHLKE